MSESPMERRLIWTEKRVASLEQQLAASQAMQCTSPFDYSPPCRGIQRVKDELAHLKTCSATEICAENPNMLSYCQQIEQQLSAKDAVLRQARNAIEWYSEEADAISKNMIAKRDNAILASVQVIALDSGSRARESLAAIDKELKP